MAAKWLGQNQGCMAWARQQREERRGIKYRTQNLWNQQKYLIFSDMKKEEK